MITSYSRGSLEIKLSLSDSDPEFQDPLEGAVVLSLASDAALFHLLLRLDLQVAAITDDVALESNQKSSQ